MSKHIEDEEKTEPSDPILALNYYIDLETDFLHYLKSVPLTKEHYSVWSPPLGNLLNNTGSIIDSFFKNMFNSPTYSAVFSGNDPENRRKNNMSTYRNGFEGIHNFSQKTIYDLYTFLPITPFSNWQYGKSPEWWNHYTAIKHNRFKNQEKATLKTVLDALGAFFLLTSIIPDTKMIMMRDGYVHSNKMDPETLVYILRADEPLQTDRVVYAKTKLFGYVYDDLNQKYSEQAKISVLSPWYRKNLS
jgi:hypothetical protein